MPLNWTCKSFNELSPGELYAIFRLRNEVFIVEQNCPYMDADNKDQDSYHLMGWDNDELAAYTRLLPPGLAYTEMSIGRVVTAPAKRKQGLGKELIEKSIEQCYLLFGKKSIRIGAQLYLRSFYTSLGFNAWGDTYLEDGIEHINMTKP